MGKSKSSTSTGGGGGDGPLTAMDKPKLQAVILADPFLNTFQPMTLDTSKVLCPLNNVAMINYTMDFLAGNGVQQVVVVCTNDQVEQQLQKASSKQHHQPAPKGGGTSTDTTATTTTTTTTWQGRMALQCIKDTSLTNAGDALRELYKRNIIQSDPFLLVYGDIVTNMDLTEAMMAHQQRHEADSSAIMTLVLAPVGATSPIQSAKDDLVVGYDPTHQNRVLLYHNAPTSSNVALPCSFFTSHPEMELRTDLMDTGVYICSPDVLGRFEDEFDYLDITKDFVTNCVAEEEEGLQTRIHAHLVHPSPQHQYYYAARIVDWATYHAISKDLLRRWCYPIVPDNLYSTTSTPQLYSMSKQYLYKETIHPPKKIARSSSIQGPGILGSRVQIDDHAIIKASVLGHDVHIGAGAVVEESHLWDHVTVEPTAKISYSVLAKNVVVKKGAVISRGCIIGEGCVIGENVVLPEFTRLTLHPQDDDPFGDDDWNDDMGAKPGPTDPSSDYSAQDTDFNVVGKDGKGRVWYPSLDEDESDQEGNDDDNGDEEKEEDQGMSSLRLHSIGYDLSTHYQKRLQRQAERGDDGFSEQGPQDNDSDMMESEAFVAYTEGSFTFADDIPSMPTESDNTLVFGRQKGVDVVKELKEICMDFDDNGNTPMENLAIELNSYKFSQNATYSDCTMAATQTVLERLGITPDMSDGKLVSGLKNKLVFWGPLLKKMSIGQAEELAIIYAIERAATSQIGDEPTGMAQKLSSGLSFRFLLQTLHDEEVLSEQTLLSWAEQRKSEKDSSPLGKLFRLQSVQDFLEWLEEGDDDDDDESSGEDASD